MSRHDAIGELAAYARSGIAILPLHGVVGGECTCRKATCRSPGKHPRIATGFKAASCDPDVIANWYGRYRGQLNWGGRPPADVVVVDIDIRSNGHECLAQFEKQHSELPATLTARTGNGWHLWFTHHGAACGKLGPGLDVKSGANGYVVLPPSEHVSGVGYEWLDRSPAAHAPGWLAQLLTPAGAL